MSEMIGVEAEGSSSDSVTWADRAMPLTLCERVESSTRGACAADAVENCCCCCSSSAHAMGEGWIEAEGSSSVEAEVSSRGACAADAVTLMSEMIGVEAEGSSSSSVTCVDRAMPLTPVCLG